jgi:hypothetical protein
MILKRAIVTCNRVLGVESLIAPEASNPSGICARGVRTIPSVLSCRPNYIFCKLVLRLYKVCGGRCVTL